MEKAQAAAWKQALATGDYTYAERFPGLRNQIAVAKLMQVDAAGAPYRLGG
jgi:hypothetical protein